MAEWSEQEMETLRALAAQGLSSGAIAKEMNRTRNSVFKRAQRQGIRIDSTKDKPVRKSTPSVRKHMRLSSVNASLDEMKAAFYAEYGGPRKLEPLAGNRYWHLQDYLLQKGYVVASLQGRKFTIRNKAGGSARTRNYKQITDLVDKLRVADGLEPLHVQNRKLAE